MAKFISLKSQIIIFFSLGFSLFLAGDLYLLFNLKKHKTLESLKSELKTVAIASSQQIDAQDLVGLYKEGQVNYQGESDDPRYQKILKQLENIHQTNPHIFLFTFVKDESFNSSSTEEIRITYLVDVWASIDKYKSINFKESAQGTVHHFNTLVKGQIEFRNFYEDKWGRWITYYVPIKDNEGKIVGAIGADIETSTVKEIQRAIAVRFLVYSAIFFPSLIIIIYGLSSIVTNGFKQIQIYAEQVGDGNYRAKLLLNTNNYLFRDEKVILSQVLQEMTAKIKNREDFLKGIFNQVAVGIAIVSKENKITMVNNTLCHILGYEKEELKGKNYLNYIYPDDLQFMAQYIQDNFAQMCFSPPKVEKRFINKKGQIIWLEVAVTLVPANGENSPYFGENQPYFIAVFQDISLRHEAQNKLIENANTDFLTRLPNRAFFMKYLENLLVESKYNPKYLFALLLVDFDNFKSINDSLGHLAGDRFLVEIAHHLKTNVRKEDLVARLGGDEFAIILPSIQSVDNAITVVQNILRAINFPFKINNREFLTSASIGVALSRHLETNTCYDNSSDLLRDADIAMYKAKAQGKNSYQVFNIAMYENLLKKLKLESELRQAIAQKSLTVYYQPIIDLQTGKLASIESLVRWWHPELGFLPPNKFLPIAEDSSLMKDLGSLILKLSCTQLQIWQEQQLIDSDVSVSVNLAGQQFDNHDLVTEVRNILSATQLSPHNLCLEVTETVIGENATNITQTLKQIRNMGVQIAIDDFGTGYSSLSRLSRFPADKIKIDKAFIKQLDIDSNNKKFLAGIISLCHNLGFEIVSEGIETQTELDIIKNLNGNYGQGFFLAQPMNSQDFEKWIAS